MDPTQNAPMPDVVVKPEPPPADAEDMLVAPTSRASRAARSPPPSEEAEKNAWMLAARYATALEAEGLTRLERQPVIVFAAKPGRGGGGGGGGGGSSSRSDYAGSAARPAPTLSHVFSLQRPIDANARESSFLALRDVLPLEAPSWPPGACAATACARERRAQGQEDAGRRPADDAQLAAGHDARASRRSRVRRRRAWAWRAAPLAARPTRGHLASHALRPFVDGARPHEGGPVCGRPARRACCRTRLPRASARTTC